jgi:pyruvate dehydrogenase E2 component (dihydrolipoamide acetyltransferase)
VQWGLAGRPVLFLHGLGSHAEVWAGVAALLSADGFLCLAVDLPGHGLSTKGGDFAFDLQGHVRWLSALADALELDRFDLVASSLGGLWAAGFATRFARRVRSLALIGAVGLEPLAPERRQWTADYLGRMDRASIAERLRRAVADPAVIDEHFIEETFRMNNSPGASESFAALAAYYRACINDDWQLPRLVRRDPAFAVLLVWGREDATVSYAGACEAAARIPGCTLCTLEATRHIPQIERPAAVHAAMARHLAGAPP